MNKRQEQKIATRARLLDAARALFTQHGFLDVTTARIAQEAGVAHGTVFVHFADKDALVTEVLDAELAQLSEELYAAMAQSGDFCELLDRYLGFLAEREDLFAALSRELPFYPPELRRKVLFRQAAVQSRFFGALSTAVAEGRARPCDVTSVVQMVFGTIHYYLALRPVFVEGGGVIEKFRVSLVNTVRCMIEKEDR